jgi:hypothetical protein
MKSKIALCAALVVCATFSIWYLTVGYDEKAEIGAALVAAESATPPDEIAAKCYRAILVDDQKSNMTMKERVLLHSVPSDAVQTACSDLLHQMILGLTKLLSD